MLLFSIPWRLHAWRPFAPPNAPPISLLGAGIRRRPHPPTVPPKALLGLLLARVQVVQKKHPVKCAGVAGRQVRAPRADRPRRPARLPSRAGVAPPRTGAARLGERRAGRRSRHEKEAPWDGPSGLELDDPPHWAPRGLAQFVLGGQQS